jgi:uncharacterized protein (TIGR02588 family)
MTATPASRDRGIGRKRTPFEWALLLVALAATLGIAAGLAVTELVEPQGPADLRVTVADKAEAASGGRPLEVAVENVGGTSAENVIVQVTVGDVTREVDLDLVAKGDTESAAVVVPSGATGPPRAQVMSYTDP